MTASCRLPEAGAIGRSKGFTLAELAVAVVILAILLFGAMIPFSAQMDIRNVADTRRTMDSTIEAIIGFAQVNGRLPCPADGGIPSGAANAGVEQYNGTSCTAVMGVVPWVTLGSAEADAWGRRFTYRVSSAFADSVTRTSWNTLNSATYTPPSGSLGQVRANPVPPAEPADQSTLCHLKVVPASSSFALCTLGSIAVFTRVSSGAVVLGSALPAIVISHGKNGYGGWQSSGERFSPVPAGNDEAANVNGTTTATPTGGYSNWAFYSRSPTPAASSCADPVPYGTSASPLCEFDDIVATIPVSTLIARMVAAGKLP